MKKLLFTIGLTIFGTQLATAASLGMAEGERPFNVSRNSETLRAEQSLPMLINVEDRIAAGESIVRIRTTAGEAVVIGKKSEIAIPEADRVELVSGDMLASMSKDSATRLQYKEVEVAPRPSDDTVTGNATAVMKAYDGEFLEVTSLGGIPLVITNKTTGEELAVANEDDVVLLTQDETGTWVAASGGKTMILQQQPLGSGGISGGGGGAMAGGGGSGGGRRGSAATAAGIGGGALGASNAEDDKDKDHVSNPYWQDYGMGNGDCCCCICYRPCASPIAPTTGCGTDGHSDTGTNTF